MSKNCKRVSTDPESGCCNVSCSKVMALLQQPPKIREMVVNHVDKVVNIVNKRSRKTSRQILSKYMSPLRLIPSNNRVDHHDSATKGAGNIRSAVKLQVGNRLGDLFNLRMASLITIVRNSMVPFMSRHESF